MMTAYERSDIVHIMKMNRFSLIDSDTAQLNFNGLVKEENYQVLVNAAEDLPSIIIKQNSKTIFTDTVKSIDDVKIFLEERLYKYLEV